MILKEKIILNSYNFIDPDKEPPNIIEIFLPPGEFYWGDRHTRIRTLLGSCIAICFWHPKLHEGGMAHIMLPYRTGKADTLDARYADEAMGLIFNEIKQNGTNLSDYHVKLFGGGKMFTKNEMKEVIGEKNILAIHKLIKKYNLNLKAECLGGNAHRRIHFELWNGIVHQKKTRHN